MLALGAERGCACEICGVGTWIKIMQQDQRLPDYLVLYHKDGVEENKNINNLQLRCLYCSKFPDIRPESFKNPRKRINKSHGHAGSAWYNNGLMNKLIKPSEFEIFDKMGWKRGRMVPKDKMPPDHTGKIRITNGVINKYIYPTEPIPEGWWRGRLSYAPLESPDYRQAKRGSYRLRRRRSKPR